jgi:alpha-galactosidase
LQERWLHDFRRDFEPLTRECLEIFGLMPTAGDSHIAEYLTWTHDPITKPWEKYDLKLQSWSENQQRRADRWAQVRAIVAGERSVDELRDAVSEGVPELIEAMIFNDNTYHQQLNLPNNGLIPNLPTDDIVEGRACINRMVPPWLVWSSRRMPTRRVLIHRKGQTPQEACDKLKAIQQ